MGSWEYRDGDGGKGKAGELAGYLRRLHPHD
jgi:hypothetical protein